MTPTEKQKCIAEQAVYRLKLEYINATITAKGYDTTDNVCGVLFWNDKGKKEIVFERDCTPILRRMSDLTEEITHKGYNDDKPFVPSKHLMKILDISEFELEYYCGNYEFALYIDPEFDFDSIRLSISKMNELLDFLNMLHFDTRNLIEKCEAIDANTLSINPYSV